MSSHLTLYHPLKLPLARIHSACHARFFSLVFQYLKTNPEHFNLTHFEQRENSFKVEDFPACMVDCDYYMVKGIFILQSPRTYYISMY